MHHFSIHEIWQTLLRTSLIQIPWMKLLAVAGWTITAALIGQKAWEKHFVLNRKTRAKLLLEEALEARNGPLMATTAATRQHKKKKKEED